MNRNRLCMMSAAFVLLSLPAGAEQNAVSQQKPSTDAAAAENTPRWIWPAKTARPGQRAFFRKEFQIKGRGIGVRLYGTCDDKMVVFINGKRVVEGDGWASPVFADVTDQVRPGRNVIAVKGTNTGGTEAGLLLRLVVEPRSGRSFEILTDGSWRVSKKSGRIWKEIKFDDRGWSPAVEIAKLGDAPWTKVTAVSLAAASRLREPTATPADQLKLAKGFRAELLYSVPKDKQGSWVNMAVDPKGRLIVSDQYGKLYRVTPPPIGDTEARILIEPIDADIGEAQGLLWAFDSLYVVVNTGGKYKSGLYRVRDTDGDDQLDQVQLLQELDGGREHGPHAILLAPDGKSLYVVAGDATKLPKIDRSRVPQVWDEDLLLPRTYGRGFMKGVPAPGGWICSTDPDGKSWELIAVGFRNQFDAAFNRHGELFAYDADMEWDMNTPWYRPTRVCHVVSGAEFGWRNGSGKWPAYQPDSLPAVFNIGPGSPTGVVFGYGAKFPARYQNALYLCDWSYGKLYALHLTPAGTSYTGKIEEFVSGTPLPLTDLVINPKDGAMYFAIGGRKTTSGFYRVSYVGGESTEISSPVDPAAGQRAVRRRLEAFHGRQDDQAVDAAWPYLGHQDRFLRWAARIAVEHQPVESWQDRALAEAEPQASLTALLALARHGDKLLQPRLLESLDRIEWSKLTRQQQLELLRGYGLACMRMGRPGEETVARLITRFDPHYPAKGRRLNAELCQMLVYLQAPTAAEKTIALLQQAPTQEEQIEYAKSLRHLKIGWTPKLREQYFSWFVKAAGYRGGASFGLFVQNIKGDAVALLSDAEKTALKPILDAKPESTGTVAVKARPFVKEWTMNDLAATVQQGLSGRDFERGRTMFGAANCFACHRFDNRGGAIGPDLTALSGRFSARDLLESIIDPSKVISDQYAAVIIVTMDGKTVTGRIVNLAGDTFRINTNMLNPDALTIVDRKKIEEMVRSKVSMMPKDLLNTLDREEVLDLMAYLLSRGDQNHAMFRRNGK